MKQIFSRQTSKGLLVVSHDCGELSATLDGRSIGAIIQAIAQPVDHLLGRITHTIGGNVALLEAEMAAIASAVALFEKRVWLVRVCFSEDTLLDLDGRGHAAATRKALAGFDVAHPEIVAALAEKNAREQAEVAARVD